MRASLKLAAIIVLIAAVGLVTGAGCYTTFQKSVDAEAWTRRTVEAWAALEKIDADLEAIESAQRGYIITGNERLLAAYRQYSTAVWNDITRSQALAFGSSGERQLNQVGELLRKRLSLAEYTVQIAQTQGFDEARHVVLTGNGAQLSEQLRLLLSRMQAEQNGLLAERSAAAARNIRLTLWLLAGFTGFAGCSIVLMAALLVRDNRRREQAETARAAAAAAEKAAHDRAADAERDAAAVLDSITDGFIALEADSRIVYLNSEAERILAAPAPLKGELLWTACPEIVDDGTGQRLRTAMLESAAVILEHYDPQRGRWLDVRGYPRKGGGMSLFLRDATALKTAHADAERASALLSGIVEHSAELIAAVGLDFKFLAFNQAYAREFQAKFGVSIAPGLDLLEALARAPAERQRAAETWGRALRGEEFTVLQDFGNTPERKYYEVAYNSIRNDKGELIGAAQLLRDFTAHQLAEESLRRSLGEKEVLLKEVHHRVKNNLQVVSSLLGLQATQSRDVQLREMLMESQNRVLSMSLIHENLYRSGDLARIDFGAYLRAVVQNLIGCYQPPDVRWNIAGAQPVLLPLDTAIPCGLIVNELVSNALKHGLSSRLGGRLDIAMERSGSSRMSIAVEDNGRGLPDGFSLASSGTLGMQIVTTLVRQLDGTIKFSQNGTTRFEVVVAVEDGTLA